MVDQYRDFADERLCVGCTYCSGPDDTVDHVPSRVFLDEPFPPNLPTVPACRACNVGFAMDEEYLACVIEAVVAGSTDPDQVRRHRVSRTLRRSDTLRSMIAAGRRESAGEIIWDVDHRRIRNIVLKLARGHAAFEQSLRCDEDPIHYAVCPMHLLTSEERDAVEAPDIPAVWGEVGSRSMQRLMVIEMKLRAEDGTETSVGLPFNDWIEVQAGRYSYLTRATPDGVAVHMLIGDYLACEVIWGDNG